MSSHSLGRETRDRKTQVHTHKHAPAGNLAIGERDEARGLKGKSGVKTEN